MLIEHTEDETLYLVDSRRSFLISETLNMQSFIKYVDITILHLRGYFALLLFILLLVLLIDNLDE